MKTVNIHGKDYAMVHERVKFFRETFYEWQILTDIKELSKDHVIMTARIFNPSGMVVAMGHAHESRTSSNINATSFIENCETSAIGRALAFLGIGIDGSIASSQEVQNAIEAQEFYVNKLSAQIADLFPRFEQLYDSERTQNAKRAIEKAGNSIPTLEGILKTIEQRIEEAESGALD